MADWPPQQASSASSSAEDTKPKAPAGLREQIAQQPPVEPVWSVPEPTKSGQLLTLDDDESAPPARCLLSVIVILATSCMCVMVITLSAVAGYRDELDDIKVRETQAAAAEIGTQYVMAVEDQNNAAYELAQARLEWIGTQEPGNVAANQRLTEVAVMLSATPLPSATATSLPPTATPTRTPTNAPTATATRPVVSEYFSSAERFYNAGIWEEAIEWLAVVIQADPNFRRMETETMLFESLTAQARIYLRGANIGDGTNGFAGNQLQRGVQLAYQAQDLWERNPNVGSNPGSLTYEANFANLFLAAQAYLDGGQYGAALTILEDLNNQNPAWGYGGVTVGDLLLQARSGSGS